MKIWQSATTGGMGWLGFSLLEADFSLKLKPGR
jgi:hypothetical protein